MSDLTLLYYTANRIDLRFQERVLSQLYNTRDFICSGRPPVVAVVQQRIDSWPLEQIVVGHIGASIYNVYRQILTAAKAATTPYVACCEDDTLYVPEHFDYRPPLDTFTYNENRLVITRKLSEDGKRREAFYYYRPRTQMAMGICGRELLIDTLEEKFAKFPTCPGDTTTLKKSGWGEPGRYEKNLGLTPRKLDRFQWTERPNVTFNHSESLMGRRRVQPEDTLYQTVEPWGDATALWDRVHG